MGASVLARDIMCVREALKIEQPIVAPKDISVESVDVNLDVGDSIPARQVLVVVNYPSLSRP